MRALFTCSMLLVTACGSEPTAKPAPPVSAVAASSSATARIASSGTTTASADAAPPASAAESAEADAPAPYPKRTTTAWPLDMDVCSETPCTLPDGTPGLTCTMGQRCFNPCPTGMGPERGRSSCAKLCKSSADCGKDPCSHGVCDRWPKHACKDPQDNCTTADGDMGFRCSPTDKCQRMCKPGLVLHGGTHCAKPCKQNAECPGGSCSEGFCVPLCPSEGCPYRWE